LFNFENTDEFVEYFVIANQSEKKAAEAHGNTLFSKGHKESNSTENGILIPEHKQMDYFFVIRGEIDDKVIDEQIQKIKRIDIVLAVARINVAELKSKQNLIF